MPPGVAQPRDVSTTWPAGTAQQERSWTHSSRPWLFSFVESGRGLRSLRRWPLTLQPRLRRPVGDRQSRIPRGRTRTSPAPIRPSVKERRSRPARVPAGARRRQGACGQRAPDPPEQEPPPAPRPPGGGPRRGDRKAPHAGRPGATRPTPCHGKGPRQEHARPEWESTPGPSTPPAAPPHQQYSRPSNDRHSRQEAGYSTAYTTALPPLPHRTPGHHQTSHRPAISGAKSVPGLVYPGVTTARVKVVTLQAERLGVRPPPSGAG